MDHEKTQKDLKNILKDALLLKGLHFYNDLTPDIFRLFCKQNGYTFEFNKTGNGVSICKGTILYLGTNAYSIMSMEPTQEGPVIRPCGPREDSEELDELDGPYHL